MTCSRVEQTYHIRILTQSEEANAAGLPIRERTALAASKVARGD